MSNNRPFVVAAILGVGALVVIILFAMARQGELYQFVVLAALAAIPLTALALLVWAMFHWPFERVFLAVVIVVSAILGGAILYGLNSKLQPGSPWRLI